ncbi:13140_t:CDS:1 [Funneliformis geosporum]|nr:13140_t:CDS:1 [Funneliformis geosporum]
MLFGFILLIAGACFLTFYNTSKPYPCYSICFNACETCTHSYCHDFCAGYSNSNYDVAFAPGIAFVFFGSILVLLTCPITARRLIVADIPEQDSEVDQDISSCWLRPFKKFMNNRDNADVEPAEVADEVNIESSNSTELQAQIRELTERLNRVENGQHIEIRENSAHEIIYLKPRRG